MAYFVLLCSLLGSVTVLSCKGVSTFINLWLCCGAPSPFTQPVLYPLVLVLASTAVLQIRFLNEAMERFGNTETVPTYYVLFTLSTIVGSNILYRDFENEGLHTVIAFGCGCLLTFLGVKLLTSKRGRNAAVADDKAAPMLANEAPSAVNEQHREPPLPPRKAHLDAEGPSGEPPLGQLFQPSRPTHDASGLTTINLAHYPPQQQPLAPPPPRPNPMHFLDEDLQDDPPTLALLASPMGNAHEVLRRTFSQRSEERLRRGHSRSASSG